MTMCSAAVKVKSARVSGGDSEQTPIGMLRHE
jgi:hypothetical protein